MIVTHSCNQPTIKLPNGNLSGIQLVSEKDGTRFTMYEARIDAGQRVLLRSPGDQVCVHYYYFITGMGKCEGDGGRDGYEVGPDKLVALSSDMLRVLQVATEGPMRVLVVYYPDPSCTFKSLEVVRGLSEVIGTERDVDWVTGTSRRLVIRKDGFPLGIHNTLVRSMTSSRLQYRNHIESVYYLTGKMTYHWQDGDGHWDREDIKVDKHNGTNYLMNFHDKHIVENHEEDSICICIFDPILDGKENHYHTKDGFSSYETLQ